MELEKNEKLLFEGKPKRAVLVVWFFTKVIFTTIICLFLVFWATGFFTGIYLTVTHPLVDNSSIDTFFSVGRLGFVLVGVVYFICALIYIFYLVRTYHYYITNQRIIFEGGIIIRKKRNIPFHKITDLTVSQNILERMLNISSLDLYTASTRQKRAEVSFVGLEDAELPQRLINKELKSLKSTGE